MSIESDFTSKVIPHEVACIIDNEDFFFSLPKIDQISSVTGGVAHQVFQITANGIRYYLKIRGDRFFSVPEITCDPADIYIEHRALIAFGRAAPEHFPQVLVFNPDKHYLVLTDAMPNGEKMEDMFLTRAITSDMMFDFGQVLAKVHAATETNTDSIRYDNGDLSYYQTVFGHRFGYRRDLVLDELVGDLSRLGNRQLILGDVSPKNIGVNDEGSKFIFFDLETAHQGDAIFDYAYFLGHILIHTFREPHLVLEQIENYQAGYGVNNYDNLMVKRIALGIMLYRLRSIIPYPTMLDSDQIDAVEQRIKSILPTNLKQASWQDIIKALQI